MNADAFSLLEEDIKTVSGGLLHKEGSGLLKGIMEEILKMEGIHKYYPGVHAPKGVDFDLEER